MGYRVKIDIGKPEQFKWLGGVIAAVFILNVLDGVMTLIWVFTGHARESNPVMDYLIWLHPAAFMAVKISLVALGALLLYRLRTNRLAVIGIFVAFIVYYAIVVGLHLSTAGVLMTTL